MNMSETGGNPPFSIDIHKFQDALRACSPMKLTGKVTQIIGLVIESQGPTVTVGELCYVSSHFSGMPPVPAEVVGFREGSVLLMPVEPGFGGQKFLDLVLPKIRRTRELMGDRPLWLQVDGGVSVETIGRCAEAGADTFVAGSAVYNASDPDAMVQRLRELAGAACRC